jgi:Fe-S cluster assembly ATPase SufC
VAVVQYTFTHKQYTERHKTNNTQNDTEQTIHRTTQNYTIYAVGKVKKHKIICSDFFKMIYSILSEEVTSSKLLWLPHTGGEDRRFEVLRAMLMKIQVILDVTQCSLDFVNPEGVAASVSEKLVTI